MSKLEEIRTILQGIDKTELEGDDGWWETSVGADFGADVLARIERLLEAPEPPSTSTGLAEVIAAHMPDGFWEAPDDEPDAAFCSCGVEVEAMGKARDLQAAHVAEELAKAGYGLALQ